MHLARESGKTGGRRRRHTARSSADFARVVRGVTLLPVYRWQPAGPKFVGLARAINRPLSLPASEGTRPVRRSQRASERAGLVAAPTRSVSRKRNEHRSGCAQGRPESQLIAPRWPIYGLPDGQRTKKRSSCPRLPDRVRAEILARVSLFTAIASWHEKRTHKNGKGPSDGVLWAHKKKYVRRALCSFPGNPITPGQRLFRKKPRRTGLGRKSGFGRSRV